MASRTESRSICEACRVSFVGVRGGRADCSARDAIRSSDRKPPVVLERVISGSDTVGPSGLVEM